MSEGQHMIYYSEGKNLFYLSHAYNNAFGSIDMAWTTNDFETAEIRLRLARLENPSLVSKMFVTTF